MRVRVKWWAVALAVATMAAPVRAQEPRPPLERGLILGSVEAAMRVPVERMENFSLVVDLSDRMLYVMSGDSVARRFPVSVGSEGYGTPPGQYRIRRLDWNPTWTPPASPWARGKKREGPNSPGNPMGRVKIFFREPDYYIHGTTLPNSLGRAASHGCIRLRNIDAVEVARMVMANSGDERGPEFFQKVLDESDRTHEVDLRRTVPIRIRA